jgi:serine/threonine protein kinase
MIPNESYRPETTAPARNDADSSEPGPDDPRVIAALEEYAAALKAGKAPAREEFQARHPEIAAALTECLEGLECIRGVPPAAAFAVADDLPSARATPPSTGVQPGMPLGDYQIVREIGRGGMGIVYEAEQLSLRRRVALKVLPFAAALDAKQLQRFKNEAQAAAHLHHTNIVPVYGVGCARGVHFYAMQYVEGSNLVAMIAERRESAGEVRRPPAPITPYHGDASRAPDATPGKETQPAAYSTWRPQSDPTYFRTVVELGIQAAQALQHAHQLGIIHRDIKPANLLVEHSPLGPHSSALRLWITDFGLAQCQNQAGLSMTGDLVGTYLFSGSNR